MNRLAAQLTKHCLLSLGHYARRLRRTPFPGVAVLCYHGVRGGPSRGPKSPLDGLHVTVEELEAQCCVIRALCTPISLADWRLSCRGEAQLPERSVLLTFDDGYRSFLTRALPILRRYRIPAVTFVCTEPAERRSLAWHDAVARRFGQDEVDRLKRSAEAEWRTVVQRLLQSVVDDDPEAMLCARDIRALADMPGVEVGAHTASHIILANADLALQRAEILQSKLRLESWTGRPVVAFAYPNGLPGKDYTPESVQLVRQLGFDFGFTTVPGFATERLPSLECPRFTMLSGVPASELAHRLAYSWPR